LQRPQRNRASSAPSRQGNAARALLFLISPPFSLAGIARPLLGKKRLAKTAWQKALGKKRLQAARIDATCILQ
jgi:hypothetical protein